MSEKGFAPAARKCVIYHDRRGRIWLAEKVNIFGRSIHSKIPPKNRAALYLRVSKADQKQDLQFDGLRVQGPTNLSVNHDDHIVGKRDA